MATNTRKPFFDRLKTGLEEGIAHARGELTLKTVGPQAEPSVRASGIGTERNWETVEPQ